MYTELVLGCSLKSETPKEVITAINYLLTTDDERTKLKLNYPSILPAPESRINWMFRSGGSYYFGAHSGEHKFTYDDISRSWRLTARFNIKNYENEIQVFLAWLHPHIEQGSGTRQCYAMVTYEEDEVPTLYHTRNMAGDDVAFPCN